MQLRFCRLDVRALLDQFRRQTDRQVPAAIAARRDRISRQALGSATGRPVPSTDRAAPPIAFATAATSPAPAPMSLRQPRRPPLLPDRAPIVSAGCRVNPSGF